MLHKKYGVEPSVYYNGNKKTLWLIHFYPKNYTNTEIPTKTWDNQAKIIVENENFCEMKHNFFF